MTHVKKSQWWVIFLIPWKATPFCPQELREVGFGSWADGFDVGQTIDFRWSIGFLYINIMLT